jgi:DNA-binding response OmpR family regulator
MSKKRVLMIDNDRFSLAVLHRLVTELGYEPMIGSTAEAAETLLEGRNPDVIIYNQDLDAEWGFSFLDHLRLSGDKAAVPVILLTQGAGRFGPRVAEGSNAAVCFQKPIAIEPFIALFRELLDKSAAGRA